MARDVYWYRYTHDDGRSKDWAYPVDMPLAASALEIYHGRTGSTLRMKSTPASQCKGGNPYLEAQRREQEKLAKGYVYLGHYTLADNRRDLTPVVLASVAIDAPPTAEATTPLPCWYWRIQTEAGGAAALYTACERAVQKLAQVGLALLESKPQDSRAMLWAVLSEGQTQGVFALCEDHAPLLAFWLLLARAHVGVRLADEAGELVTQWPEAVPIAEETLVELGLKPRNTRQLLAISDAESWYFE